MRKKVYNAENCILGIRICMDWRSIKFDWNRARAFLVTAEEGSLSAAARALDMTQPTLGRQVTALESELGVSLFERTKSGLVLTQSGHELLLQVKTMGEAATKLSLMASGQAEALEGSVCISATEVVAAFVLPSLVDKLRRQWPGIQIEILASNDTSDLTRREADIAIRGFRPTQQDLIVRRLSSYYMHLYASKEYLRKLPRRQLPKDLSDADFLGFNQTNMMVAEMNKRGFEVTEDNFPVVAGNHLVQWELVKSGSGIGFMSVDVGDAEGKVERVLPEFPPFEVERWLVVHRELKTSRRLRVVFDFLASELG